MNLVEKFLMDEADGPDGLGLYARFGYLPPRGISFNRSGAYFDAEKGVITRGAPFFEPGISVYEVVYLGDGQFEMNLSPVFLIDEAYTESATRTALELKMAKDEKAAAQVIDLLRSGVREMVQRPCFLVTGALQKFRGTGGEPCLRDAFALACLDFHANGFLTLSDRPVTNKFYGSPAPVPELRRPCKL